MKSLLLVAALLSSTAGAAFAELQSSPGLPGGLILGANGHGQLYFDPNAGMVPAAAGPAPGTVIGPDAAGRYLNPRAPGGPQRVGRTLTNTDDPLAVLALPFDGEGVLLDLANPFSGDGFGSRGSVGRGFEGKTTAAPGRWLTETTAGIVSQVGAVGVADAVAPELGVLVFAGGAGTWAADLLNPFSGDGFGSRGSVGRDLGGMRRNWSSGIPSVDGRYLHKKADDNVLLLPLDALALTDGINPWSGEGFGDFGVFGRGLVPNGAGQQVVVPGRWLTGTAGGVLSQMGEATFGTTALADFALAEGLTAATVASGAGAALGLGALAASTGTWVVDLVNPWSGDGFGSRGAAGRGLQGYGPGGFPVLLGNGRALKNTGRIGSVPTLPVSTIDFPNPRSGGGYAEEGSVGRSLDTVEGQSVLMATIGATDGAAAPFILGAAAIDELNPWSGDGVGDSGTFGRGLGVPGGFAGQMPYYSTGNAGMVPVRYDVGPQGTTISFTIPNGYNVGQMGMMPMVPAMSAPQYRVIPQYAAPAPVAYAAPATPANAAVAPAAANAGVKCQVGDQQAVALTVDACEEAGGLVQPMDAAQAAE
jgi:hypothetical protein